MIRLKAERGTIEKSRADAAAMLLFEDASLFKRQVAAVRSFSGDAAPSFESDLFTGKPQQTMTLYPAALKGRALILVGVGKRDAFSSEQLRRAAATAAKEAETLRASTLVIEEPAAEAVEQRENAIGEPSWERVGLALGEGAALALYKFDRYITGAPRRSVRIVTLLSADASRVRQLAAGVQQASIVCESTWLARDLENTPANELYPESLARTAAAIGRRGKFPVTALNESRIRALKMGGLVGVSQGSARPPRFIIMDYGRRHAHRGTVVLVGKGVTFDAGGISIKPAANMAEMKMDMSGAAAVLGTLQAAADLRIPLHVVGLVPATENLPGGRAMRPGDILRHYNGKTSEVDNTDAEGRLILADALSYAARYKPDAVIDLATLTGACVVALGHVATGMMGNNADIMNRLRDSGQRTYERVWELPMFEEYERLVKSDVADVKNVGGRWAGAITAAMFLKKFIGDYPWVHLDIAGTAIMEEPQDYIPRGGSGVGVRLLTDFLKSWSQNPGRSPGRA